MSDSEPTPPADDVRDAVAKAMCAVEMRSKAQTLEDFSEGLEVWRRFTYEAERLIAELADYCIEVRPRGTVTDAEVGHLREARAEAWDEAVAAIFAWWRAPEDQRPTAIANPYGVKPDGEKGKAVQS